MTRPAKIYFLPLLLLLVCTGCQQRASQKLQGRWEGQPDTAETRAQREAKKFGDESPAATSVKVEADDSQDESLHQDHETDWEKYDATLVMDFVSSNRLQMTMNGKQPVEGTWKILSTSPTGCTIEVETKSKADVDESSTRRRFELLFDEREGAMVGFQLTEAGADAQVGAIYFQRPNSPSDAR